MFKNLDKKIILLMSRESDDAIISIHNESI